MAGGVKIEVTGSTGVADAMRPVLEGLAEDLRQELQAASGLPHVRRGTQVDPRNSLRARERQYGSGSLGLAPKPYFDDAVRAWARRNGVRGVK